MVFVETSGESKLMNLTTVAPKESNVAETAVLATITLIAFALNLLVLVTVVSSATLRSIRYNQHVINLTVINLLLCILGMPIAIGYSVTQSWDYGDAFCSAVAHFKITISAIMCLGITMMNLDRVIAIASVELYYNRVNTCMTTLIIIGSWLIAVLLPLPLSLGIVPTKPYGSRFMCSIGAGASINYLISLYSICFVLPGITNVLFFVYIAREAFTEREDVAVSRRTSVTASQLWFEIKTSKTGLVLYLIWVFVEMPFVIFTSIEQYTISKDVDGEMEYLTSIDTGLTLYKFCSAVLMPLAIFKFRNELWLKFKDMILCRKSNSVDDASPRQEPSDAKIKPGYIVNNPNKDYSTKTSYKAKSAAPFKVPTLKATREGLHVQADTEDDESIFYADMNITGNLSHLNETAEVDIERASNAEHMALEKDDTSDYDTDPYAQSDPISVHSSAYAGFKVHSLDSGNGSASSSDTRKRRKRARASSQIESEVPLSNPLHTSTSLSGHDLPTDIEKSIDTLVESLTEQPLDQESNDQIHPVEPVSDEKDGDVVRSESSIAEPSLRAVKRKKKKRKNVTAIADAETNTSQVISLEMAERKLPPPPRLEPIKTDLVNKMATPPLRNKLSHEKTLISLPPTGKTDVADITHKTEETCNTPDKKSSTSRSAQRKKKHKSRKISGDSSKSLMSSNTSSEMNIVIESSNQNESQL